MLLMKYEELLLVAALPMADDTPTIDHLPRYSKHHSYYHQISKSAEYNNENCKHIFAFSFLFQVTAMLPGVRFIMVMASLKHSSMSISGKWENNTMHWLKSSGNNNLRICRIVESATNCGNASRPTNNASQIGIHYTRSRRYWENQINNNNNLNFINCSLLYRVEECEWIKLKTTE